MQHPYVREVNNGAYFFKIHKDLAKRLEDGEAEVRILTFTDNDNDGRTWNIPLTIVKMLFEGQADNHPDTDEEGYLRFTITGPVPADNLIPHENCLCNKNSHTK